MFRDIILLTLALFLFVELSEASGQGREKTISKIPEGTEFWLCFMKNFKDDEKFHNNDLMLELFITSDKNSEVEIEIRNIGYYKKVFVKAGEIVNVKIDSAAQIKSSGVVEKSAAVKITSNNPISVYGLNCRFQTTDTFLGLPVEVLGKEYRAMCYTVYPPMLAQFAVVAVENETKVTIIPTVDTHDEKRAGKPIEIYLDKGDVYQSWAKFIPASNLKSDMTGALIQANKKIAVFSGHQCANVPEHIETCNHLVEQMPPITSWGKHFYIGKLRSRSKYTYRVLAHYPNTKVFENSELIDHLQPGEFLERNSSNNIQITASQPVLVAQYSQGMKSGDSVGDPMMLLISPTQQFLKKYRFATPKSGYWGHYINVVAPNEALGTIKLNGNRIPPGEFKQIGISRYSIAQLEVPYGNHQIEAAEPFGMYSYGFGYHKDAFDAYGNMGGQSFLEYIPEKDILPPFAESRFTKLGDVIIFRDDRVDDTGIKSFRVLFSDGIAAEIPHFDEGIPQVSAKLTAIFPAETGSAIYEIVDVAGNIAHYTVCMSPDINDGKSRFTLFKGMNHDCVQRKNHFSGAFLRGSLARFGGDFAELSGAPGLGDFSSKVGFGGWFGIFTGIKISPKLEVSLSLSLESYNSEQNSVFPKIDSVRDPDSGDLLPYREGHILSLNAFYIEFAAKADWYLSRNIYLTGGLFFPMALTKSAKFNRRILSPDGWVFSNGSNEYNELKGNELESLNRFGFGVFCGAGYDYELSKNYTVFGDITIAPRLTSLSSEVDWSLLKFQLTAGIKFR